MALSRIGNRTVWQRASAEGFGAALAAGLLASSFIAASLIAAAPSGATTAPISQARGTFLSGLIGGKSLNTVVALNGVTAENYGGPTVTKANSLDASAMDDSVQAPLTGVLQLPGGNVLNLGAVNQFAQAAPDGSAGAASGAVTNSGGISAGGQNSDFPADATLDLSGAGGSSVANTLGNLTLTTGALAATARQDRGVAGAQRGAYKIAGMTLNLTSPAFASVTGELSTTLTTTLAQLPAQLNTAVPGVVAVPGSAAFPDAAAALTSLNLAGGAITADPATGSLHIDVAALLASLGLDLNNLPPNTHLMPYLANALTTSLPAALNSQLSALQSRYTAAFSGLGFSVAGVPVNAGQLALLTPVLNSLQSSISDALASGSASLANTVIQPLTQALASMVDLIVNGQSVNGGTFTEQALQVDLASGTSGAQLVLASASVGPSSAPAVVGAPTTPANGASSPLPGRSTIKIDAGRAAVPARSHQRVAGVGVLLLIASSAGLLAARRRSASGA
ncbi:MAG: large repetitive protein [Pseudonocardiales bacterium]|jgi:hypothetical protein|nr:large repetitive protein [Pseudonocardiales bacterium]